MSAAVLAAFGTADWPPTTRTAAARTAADMVRVLLRGRPRWPRRNAWTGMVIIRSGSMSAMHPPNGRSACPWPSVERDLRAYGTARAVANPAPGVAVPVRPIRVAVVGPPVHGGAHG